MRPGNVGTSGPHAWTVDGTEPDVVITAGPSGDHASRTATYTFTVDDSSATVECRLDGGAWQPCTPSPRSLHRPRGRSAQLLGARH